MRKRNVAIVFVCLAAVLLLLFGLRRSTGVSPAVAASDVAAGATDGDARAKQLVAAVPRAADRLAPEQPAEDSEPVLTHDERETLVMYDEMRSAFEQYGTDCLRMGEAIETSVQAHEPVLIRLRDLRDSRSAAEQAQAARRVEAAEASRLKELRAAMEQAVAKCKHDPTLRNALRKLATLNAPRDAQPTQ